MSLTEEEKMEVIWAPWRIGYILGEKSEGCFLCEKVKQNQDPQNYILERGEYVFVILNIFPYNSGHLILAPYRHIGKISEIAEEEMLEMGKMLQKWTQLLEEALNPEGFNLGLNLGEVAGAGLKDHLHYHIVPRWKGDTNFMPVLADTKVIPVSLNATYQLLRKLLQDREGHVP